jgi:hypothetical protein
MPRKLDFADLPEGLLDERKAAEVLDVAPGTLANWRSQGRGPRYVRVGTRTIRYTAAALQRFADHELVEREPADELSDTDLIRQIARLANRLARRQRQAEPA